MQTVRATISFPKSDYVELERIADKHRVSLAWVVREAVQEYLITRCSLFEDDAKQLNYKYEKK